MSENRKLAIITQITGLIPIAGADRIVLATNACNSWQCIVNKEEFHIGDTCMFFEVVSFIAKRAEFAFLDGRADKTIAGIEGYRIRTLKLRGVISQGLMIPYRTLPEFADSPTVDKKSALLGKDVTDQLEVYNYERLLEVHEQRYGHKRNTKTKKFPYFIPKTDQVRLQAFALKDLMPYRNDKFDISVKMDGTSCTVWCKDGQFGIASRNLTIYETAKRTWRQWIRRFFLHWIVLSKKSINKRLDYKVEPTLYEFAIQGYDLEKTLPKWCKANDRNIAIQGEVCGIGIQSNREQIPNGKIRFFVFDIFNIDIQRYVTDKERESICQELGLESVPRYSSGYLRALSAKYGETLEEVIAYWIKEAAGKGMFNDCREGLVFKNQDNTDFHFKVINNEYLLKHGL
jgi:RNA ligase (TIGR02306 family)